MSIAIRSLNGTFGNVDAANQRMARFQANTSNAIVTGRRGPALTESAYASSQNGFAQTWVPYWVQAAKHDMDFFKGLRGLSGGSSR